MEQFTVVDRETGDEVAVVRGDGTYDAETELARDVLDEGLGDDPTVTAREPVGGEGVEGDATVEYEPGDEGYLQTVADSLPYPLEPAEWPEEPPLDDGAGDSSVE